MKEYRVNNAAPDDVPRWSEWESLDPTLVDYTNYLARRGWDIEVREKESPDAGVTGWA